MGINPLMMDDDDDDDDDDELELFSFVILNVFAFLVGIAVEEFISLFPRNSVEL